MAREASYSEIKAARDRNRGKIPIPVRESRIEKALKTPEPGGTATHTEAMNYLAKVLVPALHEVKELLDKAGSPDKLTEAQRQNCSNIRDAVSKMMRARSPRSVDLDIARVVWLLRFTRAITREEIYKTTAHPYFNQKDV